MVVFILFSLNSFASINDSMINKTQFYLIPDASNNNATAPYNAVNFSVRGTAPVYDTTTKPDNSNCPASMDYTNAAGGYFSWENPGDLLGPETKNFSLMVLFRVVTAPAFGYLGFKHDRGAYDVGDVNFNIDNTGGGRWEFFIGYGGAPQGASPTVLYADGGWQLAFFIVNINDTTNTYQHIYWNQSIQSTTTVAAQNAGLSTKNWTIGNTIGGDGTNNFDDRLAQTAVFNHTLSFDERDNIIKIIFNGSCRLQNTSIAGIADTTPPGITLINLTSEGGLGQVVYNLSDDHRQNGTIMRTNDTTPTFFVTTNESGTCAVIDNNNDLNWTLIYAGNTNNDVGAPALAHTLTLNTSNATARFGLHNFSIGCKDDAGNENQTSASGKLLINITDNTPPNITLYNPLDNFLWVNEINLSSPLQFNWSANDNNEILNCSLLIDNTLYHNSSPYLNQSLVSSNITYSSVGIHTWNLSCYDSFNNWNSSARTFEIKTIVNVTIFLNGSNESRSYEYATNLLNKDYGVELNVTAMPNQTICLDFGDYVNWTCFSGNGSIRFNVTELNVTKLMNGNFSINMSAGIENVSIYLDNNTEIDRILFKLKGYDIGGYPVNLTIDVDKDGRSEIIVPGYIKENEVAVYDFSSSLGANIRAQNITFISAGSLTIQINVTSILSIKNFSAFISASELDKNNEFSVEETFNTSFDLDINHKGVNNSFLQNETLSYQTDSGLWMFDDFAINKSIWTASSFNSGDELQYGPRPGTIFFSTTSSNDLNYDDNSADFRNTSWVTTLHHNALLASGSDASLRLYLTDGTINLLIKEWHVDSGVTSDYQTWNITFIKYADNDAGRFDIYQNGTAISNINIKDIFGSSLPKQIKLMWRTIRSGGASGTFYLDYVKWGGVALNYSANNGTYKPSGNVTSRIIKTTANNVSIAQLSWTAYEPSGTEISGYIANNCNDTLPTFNSVINGISNIFTTTGNNICWRFSLNSSSNTTTPVIRKVSVSVSKSAARNISADCGADGDIDFNFPDELNSTTSPRRLNCTNSDLDDYRLANCRNSLTCMMPVRLLTTRAGILSIDSVNFSQYNLQTGNFTGQFNLSNTTKLENITIQNWTFSFLNGKMELYGLDEEFKGSQNRTLFAHSAVNSSDLEGTANLTLRVFYIKFNSTFPKGINEMQLIYPEFFNLNQSNISIYGQTIRYCNSSVDTKCAHYSTPIFNVTNLAYDLPIDIYLYSNNTINHTINTPLTL